MSKYKPLERYLRTAGRARLPLTFAQIEKIVGGPLPASARRYPAWWSNNEGTHVQAQAWLESGYKTYQVDIEAEKLIFVSDDSSSSGSASGVVRNAARPLRSLFGSMKGTTIVTPGVDLTQPTAPEWGERDDQ